MTASTSTSDTRRARRQISAALMELRPTAASGLGDTTGSADVDRVHSAVIREALDGVFRAGSPRPVGPSGVPPHAPSDQALCDPSVTLSR